MTSPVLDARRDCSVACPAEKKIKDFSALLTHAEHALMRAEAAPGQEYQLNLTAFTEQCTRVWVRRHGRSFGRHCRASTSRPVPKKPKTETDAAVRAGQKRALDQLVV